MKILQSLLLIFFFLLFSQITLKADTYFLDFKVILDESVAGKKANKLLKEQFNQEIKKLKERESRLQKEEKEIIQQKKILSAEDYKKKISALRKKVSDLQKDRKTILDSFSKKRNNARNQLIKSLNPIVKNYMKENNIKIMLDKKSILLADENLDITKQILNLLNKDLKSLKIN